MRALFAPLFGFGLFYELEREAKAAGLSFRFAPALCGLAFFILSALWRLPDPYGWLSLLSFLPMMPANAITRRLNASLAPGELDHAPWSALNVVGAILGVAVLLLYFVDTASLEP